MRLSDEPNSNCDPRQQGVCVRLRLRPSLRLRVRVTGRNDPEW